MAAAHAAIASHQGLTLVHFLTQCKHILWCMLGALLSASLLRRWSRGGVTKTA